MDSGLVLVDKPEGITSHHVVSAIKKSLGKKDARVGHLGTLDPFATGLLPIMIGGTTKLADKLIHEEKQYLFTLSLGQETDTLDLTGRVVKEADVSSTHFEKLEDVIKNFHGKIKQIPPVYSAIKMQGRPLYEYMRAQGELPFDIATKVREIFIHKLDCVYVDKEKNTILLRALCSKGTYVRSLARDIAYALGTVGHCSTLRRERIGEWSTEQSYAFVKGIELDVLRKDILKNLLPIEELLPHHCIVHLNEKYLKNLLAGQKLVLSEEEFRTFSFSKPFLNFDDVKEIIISCENHSLLFLGEFEYSQQMCSIHPRKKLRD